MRMDPVAPPTYRRTVLHQTDHFEVVTIDWNQNSESPEHDHGWSQCLVLIEEGVFENCLNLGTKTEVQRLEAGQVLNTPVGSKHAIRCVSASGRTLQVYSPKLTEPTDHRAFSGTGRDDLEIDLKLSEETGLDRLKELVVSIRRSSVSSHSPYFMNQLFSGISPLMLMAEELINQTKTTLATREASPIFSTMEREVIESLGQTIGWAEDSRDGVGVPGGSAANMMAVHCARHRFDPRIKQQGMAGQKFKIFVSTAAHYSFQKACIALGFGTGSLVSVAVDECGRMNSEVLERLVLETIADGTVPLMVVATAGTTVAGAFDPIKKIARICQENSIWLHVDAAWGGPALFSGGLRHLVGGIELADSVTFDAHKLFGANLVCSFFLTRHRNLLLQANDVSGAEYLFHDTEDLDYGRMSWQCGRRADAVSFWMIWKNAGSRGLGEFVDRLVDTRDEVLVWISTQPRLKLVGTPEFLNICVRILPPTPIEDTKNWSKFVRESLKAKNLAMVNYSADADGTFLRLILAHPYLEVNHVKEILRWSLEVR